MSTAVIIMGAKGRMGSTLAAMAMESEKFTLAGVVERAERAAGLELLGCPVANTLAELVPACPGAVVIDFTAPEVSLASARTVAATGNPLVIGTTGLSAAQIAELETLAAKTPIFWSPNMSIGVNALVRILPALERILGEAYDMEITEIHHHHKKDAPSGTAVKLAQVLAQSRGWNLDEVGNYGRQGIVGARPEKELGVHAVRGGDVVGDHTVYFFGPGERIEVTHRAHSRENFARGALRAATWLASQKPGRLYTMSQLMGE
ncbi:MAG: 4-hydroxy-tetrahydrodipicolinate reductase [Deltaproteobacteria bacterium]|nr:4-hydroxy-tetrahydrodipicolinate reductase [Deltaproteobacteria bacterium]